MDSGLARPVGRTANMAEMNIVTELTARIIELVRAIPRGKVATYGGLARMAGSPRAARQVVRVLHSCSNTHGLPWHRVVNRLGRISLKPFQGAGEQKRLLDGEGVEFGPKGRIDLERFLWIPEPDPARRGDDRTLRPASGR